MGEMESIQHIEARVEAGKALTTLVDMVFEEAINHPITDFVARVVERLCMIDPTAIPEPKQLRDPPMSDKEALIFEQERLTFGQYDGMRIGDIPIGYLQWLITCRDVRRELNHYMQSPIGQRRQEEGE